MCAFEPTRVVERSIKLFSAGGYFSTTVRLEGSKSAEAVLVDTESFPPALQRTPMLRVVVIVVVVDDDGHTEEDWKSC